MTGIGQERGQAALPDGLTTQELHKAGCGSNSDEFQSLRIYRCIRALEGAQGRNRTTDTAIFSRTSSLDIGGHARPMGDEKLISPCESSKTQRALLDIARPG